MQSLREVREYLGGDRIVCLICGKHFRGVGHHVRLAHGITADDYKRRFGLPVGRGVATGDARAKWAASVSRTHAEGKLRPKAPPAQKGRPPPVPAYALHDLRRIDPAIIDKLLQHLYRGRTLTEACEQPGMPRWTWVHQAMKRDYALMAKIDAAIESLPFAQQARMKKLGARFAKEVRARNGWTSRAIAADLGVSEEAVRRQVVRNRKEDEQPPEPRP